MGAYLSEPVVEKHSEDQTTEFLSYGASSMQGWRITQEDAHNCIPYYDKFSSLFAVYDGHGGSEVAEYCSLYLPDYIKNVPAYKAGNYVRALEDAFIGFDATILRDDVQRRLRDMAGTKPDEDEVDVDRLRSEAEMPLDHVLDSYKIPSPSNAASTDELPDFEKPGSSRDSDITSSKLPSLPAIVPTDPEAGPSKPVLALSSTRKQLRTTQPQSPFLRAKANELDEEEEPEKLPPSEEKPLNGETEKKESPPDHQNGEIAEKSEATPEKIQVPEVEAPRGGSPVNASPPRSPKVGGKGKGNKGKALLKKKPQSESDDEESPVGSPVQTRSGGTRTTALAELLNTEYSDDSSSSEDSNYEATEDEDTSSDDDDDDNEAQEKQDGSSGSAPPSTEKLRDWDDDDEDDDDDFMGGQDEPGYDSGCTAVVALLHGSELYVANAGDSRCVVCRAGRAIEMSVDHKPEDVLELRRIIHAGGRVTADGRVNGGLNLSRAIGDHTYKQNRNLTPREQMISALPDVRSLTLDVEKDEFMVLACDGIWNYMNSQEVCDFIRHRLSPSRRLSTVCEELCDHCLAPHTRGDGTGCDNMTIIIIHFHKNLFRRSPLRSDNNREGGSWDRKAQRVRSPNARSRSPGPYTTPGIRPRSPSPQKSSLGSKRVRAVSPAGPNQAPAGGPRYDTMEYSEPDKTESSPKSSAAPEEPSSSSSS